MSKQYYEEIDFSEATGDADFGVFVGDPRNKCKRMWLRPVTLPSTGWVSLEDRKPTVEDGNAYGSVLVLHEDGHMGLQTWTHVGTGYPERVTANTAIAWFSLSRLPKFAPKVPTFGEWLNSHSDVSVYDFKLGETFSKWITEKHAEYSAKFGGSK
jgi:hypothetical protein